MRVLIVQLRNIFNYVSNNQAFIRTRGVGQGDSIFRLINLSIYRSIIIFQFVFIDFELCIRYFIQLFNGKMTELAEGARLEIVCTVNSGTPGSNPGLSAPNDLSLCFRRYNSKYNLMVSFWCHLYYIL